jgi:uncharacterized protein YqeY
VNAHALSVLEFQRTLDVVGGYASSPAGAAHVRALRPSDDVGEIELRRDVTDDDVVDVVRKAIKRRREAIDMYLSASRDDLVANERAELATLEGYMPAQIDPEEIRKAVRAAIEGGAANIGAVMGKVVPQFKGRAEGSTINAIAREELSGR